MAKVTILIEDLPEEGSVNVKIESEPGWPGPAAESQELTVAQEWGLRFMQMMKGEAHEARELHDHEHHEGCGCEHTDPA